MDETQDVQQNEAPWWVTESMPLITTTVGGLLNKNNNTAQTPIVIHEPAPASGMGTGTVIVIALLAIGATVGIVYAVKHGKK